MGQSAAVHIHRLLLPGAMVLALGGCELLTGVPPGDAPAPGGAQQVGVGTSTSGGGAAASSGGTSGQPSSSGGVSASSSSGGGGCVTDRDFYVSQVAPLVEQCTRCHAVGGGAEQTGFVLTPGGDDAAHTANMAAFAQVASHTMVGLPDFVLKPSHQVPHGGGLVLAGAEQVAVMTQWANRIRRPGACSDPGALVCSDLTATLPPDAAIVPLPMRRMTPTEYARTLDAAFGSAIAPGVAYPPASSGQGFTRLDGANPMSLGAVRSLMEAAEDVALQVLEFRPDLVPCSLSGGDRMCAEMMMVDLGQTLFRGPVSQQDGDRFLALFDALSAEPFDERVAALLAAMLQSPAFLYHRLEGTPHPDNASVLVLESQAVAARLSYLLADGPPDATLMQAAQGGQLQTAAQVRTQAERLLADPAAREPVLRFFREWLLGDLPRVRQLKADDAEFVANIDTFVEELDRFIWALWQQDETLAALFTSPMAYVNQTLATFLEVPFTGQPGTWAQTDLTGVGRAGILTRPGLVAALARSNNTASIYLGKFVRERLLCQHMPAAPAGAAATPVEGTTARERSQSRVEHALCGQCHQAMEPVGWAFLQYNLNGRRISNDPDISQGVMQGAAEATGYIEGVLDLSARLSTSSQVRTCAARHALAYAMARPVETLDGCALQGMVDDMGPTPRLRQLFLTAVTNPAFLHRRLRTDTMETP